MHPYIPNIIILRIAWGVLRLNPPLISERLGSVVQECHVLAELTHSQWHGIPVRLDERQHPQWMVNDEYSSIKQANCSPTRRSGNQRAAETGCVQAVS